MKKTDTVRGGVAIARILLISDNLEIGMVWSYSLEQRGWQSVLVGPAQDALVLLKDGGFDLIIVDVHRSGLDTVRRCQQLRAETIVPILLFTGRGDEASVLELYDSGVSECIVKPVSPALFLAKVKAWLGFSWTVTTETLDCLRVGDTMIDPPRRGVVTARGDFVRLSNLEFRVLYLLMNHKGRVLETSAIVDRVWRCHNDDDSVLLKNVIYRLRQKLEPDPGHPRYIITIPGVGYAFQSE